MSRNLHFFYYLFPTAEAWRHPEQADNVYWVFFFWSVGAAHRSGPQAELSAGWMTMNRVSDRCRIIDKHHESSSMLHKFCSYRNFPGSHLGKVLHAAFVERGRVSVDLPWRPAKDPRVYKVDQTLYFKQQLEVALACLHTGAMLLLASSPFRENVAVGPLTVRSAGTTGGSDTHCEPLLWMRNKELLACIYEMN